MSSTKKLMVLAMAGAILLTAVIYAQEARKPSFDFLSDGEFKACGLHKLTAEEQALLFSRIALMPLPSYCEMSAEAYMKSERYHKIRVLGAAVDPESSHRHLLYVWYKYQVTVLNSSMGVDPLEPGIYWCDHNDLSPVWDIMYPNGEEETFWERD